MTESVAECHPSRDAGRQSQESAHHQRPKKNDRRPRMVRLVGGGEPPEAEGQLADGDHGEHGDQRRAKVHDRPARSRPVEQHTEHDGEQGEVDGDGLDPAPRRCVHDVGGHDGDEPRDKRSTHRPAKAFTNLEPGGLTRHRTKLPATDCNGPAPPAVGGEPQATCGRTAEIASSGRDGAKSQAGEFVSGAPIPPPAARGPAGRELWDRILSEYEGAGTTPDCSLKPTDVARREQVVDAPTAPGLRARRGMGPSTSAGPADRAPREGADDPELSGGPILRATRSTGG